MTFWGTWNLQIRGVQGLDAIPCSILRMFAVVQGPHTFVVQPLCSYLNLPEHGIVLEAYIVV